MAGPDRRDPGLPCEDLARLCGPGPGQPSDAAGNGIWKTWPSTRKKDLLTDSQLQAAVREVSVRLSNADYPTGLHVLLPAQVEVILQTQELPQAVLSELQAAPDVARPMLLLALVHSQFPRHYSLVVLERQADKRPARLLTRSASGLQQLLYRQAGLSDKVPLPPPANSFRQADGFSCGFWAAAYGEAEWRLFLCESRQAVDLDLDTRVDRLNRWIVALLRTRHNTKMAEVTAAAMQPHQAAAGSSSRSSSRSRCTSCSQGPDCCRGSKGCPASKASGKASLGVQQVQVGSHRMP